MPTDRWIIDRAIDAYRGRYPHPEEYASNEWFPDTKTYGPSILDDELLKSYESDLIALIEHVIDYVKQEESR